MAAPSDPGTRMLTNEPSGSRLIPASGPDQGSGKDTIKIRSAKVKAQLSGMERFIQYLLRALSAPQS